ncbi:hypothetical protein J4E90_008003 [Alternaria incomplexa]|uniref:uncharacterized protein n=1 Tax=Alternaria incomplexa TaxID=1187928 RepID=UPI00221EEEAF|nr:uncharacterized protein J4E90_008003 [Alternaria incomplexa]KAI4909306.1 hypothetical protein J4E90_008003 [Alternaria incomplexa]
MSHVCVEAAEATSRFIFDGLSLVNFFDSQFPGKDAGGTSLKIKAGLADPGNDEDSLRFYYSKEKAGTYQDTGKDYIPSCTGLDEDVSNDIVNATLKFSLGAYGKDVTSIGDKEVVITNAAKPAKRSIPKRPMWMHEHLIVSNWTSQTAPELCDSAMSWGLDFVESDGQFCDMATKTLTPLCSSETVGSSDCVDVDEEAVSVVKRTSVARRAAKVTHKSYKKIQKWNPAHSNFAHDDWLSFPLAPFLGEILALYQDG